MQIFNIPEDEILFVFALEIEAAEFFKNLRTIFTGIGKINAATHLQTAIHIKRPKLIVNLGSAGSPHFNKGEVICCNAFVQRDMDVRGLGYALYETPLSGIPPILHYGEKYDSLPIGICGTGDSFETKHIANSIYNVVDMESYALALIAQKEQIPFLCLKYISDGANDEASDSWFELVHKAGAAFDKILRK